jgi:sugar/nucleoside kinase (ribokinase family)
MSAPIHRLLLAGEALVDLMMWVPSLPERGGDQLATSSGVAVGGGFNVMAAAARQGLPVRYAGGHGTGPWGDLVRSALTSENIELLRPRDPRADTGFDVALVEPAGERTFVTSLGAESLPAPDGWEVIPAVPGDAVYVSGYGLAAPVSGPELGRWATRLPTGVTLFIDPGPLIADIPPGILDPVLDRADWWSCNQREATLLTGTDQPAEAARQLRARLPRASIMVRTGAAGCTLATGDDPLTEIPAPHVAAVDTTGAGDAHAGVFLASLADGLPPVAAAARANAAAALSTTRTGPATAPARDELDRFLAGPAPPDRPGRP